MLETSLLETLMFFSVLLSPPLLIIGLIFAIAILLKMRNAQRSVLTALETANRLSAEMLDALKTVNVTPPAEAGDDEADDDDEGETPADFVYCPECSTRVEIDPTIRNINIVCPDCKKPFHIH